MVVQPGLCHNWSETPKIGILMTQLIFELKYLTKPTMMSPAKSHDGLKSVLACLLEEMFGNCALCEVFNWFRWISRLN